MTGPCKTRKTPLGNALPPAGCRIAERTQIQVPGLNGRVEEPVKSPKTT